jgi:hypothetical protein
MKYLLLLLLLAIPSRLFSFKAIAHLRFWEDRVLTASPGGDTFLGPAAQPDQSSILHTFPHIEAIDFNHGAYATVFYDTEGYRCRVANVFSGSAREVPLNIKPPLLTAMTRVGYQPACAVIGVDGSYRLFNPDGTVDIQGKLQFTGPVAPHAASIEGHTLAVRHAHNRICFYDLLTERYTHKLELNGETYIQSLVLQDHRIYFTTPWDLLYSAPASVSGTVQLISRDVVESVHKSSSGHVLVQNKKSVGVFGSKLRWVKAPDAIAFDYDSVNRNIAWVSAGGVVHLLKS